MPSAARHMAVINLTQSDKEEDSQQSPYQLPGMSMPQQPIRKRLQQGGGVAGTAGAQRQAQQADRYELLEDDDCVLQPNGAEQGQLKVESHDMKESSRTSRFSKGSQAHKQHKEHIQKERGKRGRNPQPQHQHKEHRKCSNGRIAHRPARDVSSSPECGADSESEEEGQQEEASEEEEDSTKGFRKRGRGRVKETEQGVGVQGGKKSRTAAKGSHPAKAPLQLTLSQFARPQSHSHPLQPPPLSSTQLPSSSQQQQALLLASGDRARAGAVDCRTCPSSPAHHKQHPITSSSSQQQPLSQRSALPPSPTRPSLQLSKSVQQLREQQQQRSVQQSKHQQGFGQQPGGQQGKQQGLVFTGGSYSRGRGGIAAAGSAAKLGRASSPCPSHNSGTAACQERGVLWSDKHTPADTAALAVHRKKVEDVRNFLQHQHPGPLYNGSRMLIASGPAGCGKSTTVRLLAAESGYQVVEYNPPTPTLWSELQHQDDLGPLRSLGPSYVSKLDDFEAFVARAKFPALPLASKHSTGINSSQPPAASQQQGSSAKKLLLIDDLPHVHDLERSHRLAACLASLAETARGPVVLICTQSSGGSGDSIRGGGGNLATGGAKGLSKDVMAALEGAGATLLNFNPLTANCVTKVLQQVAAAEGCPLSPDAAASIAGLANGDVRNAIQTLQALFAGYRGPKVQGSTQRNGKSSGGRGNKAAKVSRVGGGLLGDEAARIASTQRDLGLDIFHALGKLLYNKREVDDDEANCTAGGPSKRGQSKAAEAAAVAVAAVRKHAETQTPARPIWMPSLQYQESKLHDSMRRLPFKYDPEAIVSQSGLDPIQVAAFLHENYLNFIAEEAIEDVSGTASYISDAAFMASFRSGGSSQPGGVWGLEEPSSATNLSAACAGSVAARGLLFANTHPAPRRWTPLQAPAQNRMERARNYNAERVQDVSARLSTWHGTLAAGGCSAAVSAQVMPWLRSLAHSPDYQALCSVLPNSWSVFTLASHQNVLAHAQRAPHINGKDVSQPDQLQQLEWMREQQGESPVGEGRGDSVLGEDDDPIDD